mmetsp:Transcript_33007/g.29260  ORF Transcript_33007/g.29260 Transcript_33007/m.29260 type:complete len:86 (+) Transcript_33007:535-792(+)
MIDQNSKLEGEELDKAADTILSEYELQLEGVKESYKKFINIFKVNKPMDEMEQDLLKMVRTKVDNSLIPPGIVFPERIAEEDENI